MSAANAIPVEPGLKVGDTFTITRPKPLLRRLWARLRGQPVTEVAAYTVVSTTQSDRFVFVEGKENR